MSFVIRIKNRVDQEAVGELGFEDRESAEAARLATDWVAEYLETVAAPDIPAGEPWTEAQLANTKRLYASHTTRERDELRRQMLAPPN